MAITYDEFKAKYNGKFIDFDLHYGAQCVDLFRQYCKELGFNQCPPVKGAADLWSNAFVGDFRRIFNTPTGVPKKGDVMIWAKTLNGYGHVGIFESGNIFWFNSLDQNFPLGSPVHVQRHSYKHIIGWLRPILAQIPAVKEVPIALIGLQSLNSAIREAITARVLQYTSGRLKLLWRPYSAWPCPDFSTDEGMALLEQVKPTERYCIIGTSSNPGYAKTSYHPALNKAFAICPQDVSADVVIHELLHCLRKYRNFNHLKPYIEDIEIYGPNWDFERQYQQLATYADQL